MYESKLRGTALRLVPGRNVVARLRTGSLLLALAAAVGCAEESPQADENLPEEAPPTLKQARAPSGLTRAHTESVLYRNAQALTQVPRPRGDYDDMATYVQKCEAATGIRIPAFSCEDGSTVPNQGTKPSQGRGRDQCDRPNVLNGQCDPGSKFQVLRGSTANAVAVAHCRKVGLPIEGPYYDDIAIIQYNKSNGAVCFYQALGDEEALDGSNVPAPGGPDPWRWYEPASTHDIGCTSCHDTGGFLRSSYLAQPLEPAKRGHNMGKAFKLPNQDTGWGNKGPLRFVGADYKGDQSWSITLKGSSPCTGCHNLAVNKMGGYDADRGLARGLSLGTAVRMAGIATAATQDSRLPSAPPWMPPGTRAFSQTNADLAKEYAACATGYLSGKLPANCQITPLGKGL